MICEWHNGVTQSKFIVSGRNCSICPIFDVLYMGSFCSISRIAFPYFLSFSWLVWTDTPIFALLSSSVAFFSSPWTDVHPRERRAVLRVGALYAVMSKICPGYVQERSFLRACATGKTRWVFLLVRGPWWTSPHTVWAWASSGQRWSPLSCPSWGYHHGCFAPRCYRMSRPLSARR